MNDGYVDTVGLMPGITPIIFNTPLRHESRNDVEPVPASHASVLR
jgi:hypothetical protein